MKRILMMALVAMFVAGGVLASNTRVTTMGEVNNIVKDDANIWLYPSTINYYPGVFSAEFDGGDFWGAGANFGLNEAKPWVLGAYFQTYDYYHSIVYDYSGWNGLADHRIDLFYGRNLGEIPFGFNFNFNRSSEKNEDAVVANNYEWALSRFGFSFGLSPLEGKLDLAAGIFMTSWSDKDYILSEDAVLDITKPSGNMDLFFNGRYWMDPMGKYILVPHASLWYSKQGLEHYDVGTKDNTYTYSDMEISAGMGMNYEAKEDVLVVTDFGVLMETYNEKTEPVGGTATEDKESWTVLPFFKIGIDAVVFKWMDFRAGVSNYWVGETHEPGVGLKHSYGYTDVSTYLGAGFHWGDFEIDAAIEPDFLEHGPYFISGSDGDLTSCVSVLYWFD